MVILGVDPGLRATGIVFVEKKASSVDVRHTEEILTDKRHTLAERLNKIFSTLECLISEFKPEVLVLEKIYSHYRHPNTVAVLGHVRGIIVLMAAQKNIKIVEYAATRVKKAVTSYGTASKRQTLQMVSYLFRLKKPVSSEHIADALALVAAYMHTQRR